MNRTSVSMPFPLIRFMMFGCVFIAALSLSCDESLPPRDDPQQFLVTTAIGLDGALTYRGGLFDGTGGMFLLRVKNVYSEVLEGEERIRGDIDVWLRDMPEKHSVVQATKRDLTNGGLVTANLVKLGPDTTATLLKRWEHRVTFGADSGRFFWEYVDSTLKYDSHGNPYYESDPVRFVASARIQIFRNVQAVTVKRFEFTVVYLRFL